MYLRKPDIAYEGAFLKYMSLLSEGPKTTPWPAGGAERQEAWDKRGYKAWLLSLTALNNSDLRSEPGDTYLIADPIDLSGPIAPGEDTTFEREDVPMFPDEDLMVGIVSFLRVREWISETGKFGSAVCPKDMAALNLSLLPSYSNTSGFLRALSDALTHVVCNGLPYKDVVCLVDKNTACPEFVSALSRCAFQLEGTLGTDTDIWRIDLRVAHLLRRRIQTFNYEREE